MLEKTKHMVMLLDCYSPLLTAKQGQVLNLYYELDLTISEIAENMDTSRQAIFDLLKRAEHSLINYENKLGLVVKFREAHEKLEEVYNLIDQQDEDKTNDLTEALEILREVKDRIL
ncbi:MAG TPA: sigma factor-like helix-turn-helix DNA-binding protein [Syntrophomonadaceae bacterium]|nr:sigma factor-like helix-turn-helix DNA-binding protein [Syntrophomonadaceae bacterium]